MCDVTSTMASCAQWECPVSPQEYGKWVSHQRFPLTHRPHTHTHAGHEGHRKQLLSFDYALFVLFFSFGICFIVRRISVFAITFALKLNVATLMTL